MTMRSGRYLVDMFRVTLALTSLSLSLMPGAYAAPDGGVQTNPFGRSAPAKNSASPASTASTASTAAHPAVHSAAHSTNAAAASANSKTAATSKAAAAKSPESAPSSGEESAADENTVAAASLSSPTLAQAIQAYRSSPSEGSWSNAWREINGLLLHPLAIKSPVTSIYAANPGLGELSPRVVDAEGGRVWSFPRQPEAQGVILQWQGSAVRSVESVNRRGRRIVHSVAVPVSKAQAFAIPQGVTLTDAHLVRAVIPAPVAKAPVGRPAVRRAPVRAAAPTVSAARFLVFTGIKPATATVWLSAYKLVGETWAESPEVLSALPPFLIENVAGRASFSGNDIALDVCAKGGKGSEEAAQTKVPSVSSGYRIVLRFVGGKYSLEGKNGEDAPMMTALQFVQAIQQGRADLAKGWLADPKLLNIPKYLGILGKTNGQPFKLIAMANPNNGVTRFRLITFEKDDLIIDVGKYKNQQAVKGLFIAPPDPLAQKLLGNLPAVDKMVEKSAEPKPAATPTDRN